MSRGAARALCGLAGLWLGGCASVAPALVQVRDRATAEPIAGAEVRVENTGINPLKPAGDSGVTDAAGEVVLRFASYNRLLVTVRAPGRPAHVLNADHPAAFGDTGWITPTFDEAGGRGSVEVRLSP